MACTSSNAYKHSLSQPLLSCMLTCHICCWLPKQRQICRILDCSEDQDSTDLHKCLDCAAQRIKDDPETFPDPDHVTVLAIGQRLLHAFCDGMQVPTG